MSKEKAPASTTPSPPKQSLWARMKGKVGKSAATDPAKTSGTSPPPAAPAATPEIPLGTPPEVDLSGFQLDGESTPAPAQKPKSDGATTAKQCRAVRAICQKHHPAILGIIFDPDGIPGEMPGHIGFLIDTAGDDLSAGQKGALWDFAIGAFFTMCTERYTAKPGASADDATKAKEEWKKAVGAFIDEIDPLNHPEADLKGVFRLYSAMLGALLGHEARAGRIKVQLPVKTTTGKAKDPDDSDGPLPMPKDDPPPKGGGTPIHADSPPGRSGTSTGGMGQKSLLEEAGVDLDTIPLAVEGEDKPKGKK